MKKKKPTPIKKGRKPVRKQVQTKAKGKLYEGRLELTKSGVGFVIVADLEEDICVLPHLLGGALHGDEVLAQLIKGRQRRLYAKIVRVLKKGRLQYVGTLQKEQEAVTVTIRTMQQTFSLPVQADERLQTLAYPVSALVELREEGKHLSAVLCRIFSEKELEQKITADILSEKKFPIGFDKQTEQAAERIKDAEDKGNPQRLDFTDRFTCTIDPEDAKDFDDALSLKYLDDHTVEIGIHIADVGYFVTPGSLLDREAYKRATSVYLPSRVAAMLPEYLSNGLCSLVPGEPRLAFAAIVHYDLNKHEVVSHYFSKTRIFSKRRFTYEEVQRIIETGQGDFSKELLLFHQVARILRKKRMQKGSINFHSSETRFILDADNFPIDTVIKISQEAHQLIEDFMLLANRLAAQYLSTRSKREQLFVPYRVHDKPDEAKLESFVNFVRKKGYTFNVKQASQIAKNYNELLAAVRQKPEAFVFDRLGIRAMAKACYDVENIGHFGLGFKYYCHFTSPIRRYPDILIHRALAACLSDGVAGLPAKPLMQEMSLHCSERERAALECERSAHKYKQVQFLSRHIGEVFEGVISGVSTNGFWVETLAHQCEGMVRVSDMAREGEDFIFVAEDYALKSTRRKMVYQMGDKVTIKVVRCDLDRREIDFEPA